MRLFVGILVFLAWSAGSGYWYTCKIKGLCPETASAPQRLVDAVGPVTPPLATTPPADSVPADPAPDSLEPAGQDQDPSAGIAEETRTLPDPPKKETSGPSAIPAKLRDKRTVLFSFAQPIMQSRPDLVEYIRTAAAHLLANPGTKMRLVGYTDDTAARENNLKLGMRRAEAVAELFRAEGVNDAQLVLESGGEANPVGDNNTREGRQQNRRVEMQLIDS